MSRTVLLCILVVGIVPRAVHAAGELFDAAALAPADVTTYVHVDDAAGLRDDFRRRPIMRWVGSMAGVGQVDESWRRLAVDAGVDGAEMFDAVLGRQLTVMARTAEGGTREWAAVTRVEPAVVDRLFARLRPVARTPLAGMAVASLPEHDLVIARRDDWLVIGPATSDALFREVLGARSKAIVTTLAGHPGVERGRTLGDGRAGVFIRHDPPLGGWSVVVADVHDGRVTMRHDARFDNPPFRRDATATTWNVAPLQAFEEEMLTAVMEPTDVGGGAVEAWLHAVLAQPLLSDALRANMGGHRIIAVGELEGRRETGVDLLLPTAAVCILLLEDPESAERALDEKVLSIARRLNELTSGAARIPVPARRTLVPGEPRRIDLTPLVRRISGGLPVVESISLNWTVTDAAHGPYAVLATHPQQLRDTVEALGRTVSPARLMGRWCQCGTANGQRLGHHLRSYADQAGLLAEPGSEAAFVATLNLVSELAGGVQRCRWKLARPETETMSLEIELILAPAESSE